MSTPGYSSSVSPAPRGANLADVLERVLDKGLVVAGDIRINLLDIELLTIRIRLLLVSAEKAEEMGISWWRNDPFFAGGERNELNGDAADLRERLDRLESKLQALPGGEPEPNATMREQKEQMDRG